MAYGPFMTVNEAGHLEVDGCDAVDLADVFGTPLWVISENTIRRNYRTLRDAFLREYPGTRVAYASKANPEPAVIRVAKLEGALVDVVTMGHIRLVLTAGFEPGEIIFNGNSKTPEELRWALAHGVAAINVDSLDEMETIARLQPFDAEPAALCLRLAVDERRFEHDDPEFAAHWRGSKFGMDEDDALAAAKLADEHPALRLEGLHHHFGWSAYGTPYDPELDLARHRRSLEQVVEFAALLRDSGAPVSVLNVGGGFRRARPEGFGPGRITVAPSAEEYAQTIGGGLAQLAKRHDLGSPELVLEPGGYLVADAAVLLGRVGLRKRRRAGEGERTWAFLENTSAYHFVRRLMFHFEHHVVVASKADGEAEEAVSLAGPICADDDVALDAALPALERGDLVAVLDQGAYCEAVTSDYCAVPIPAAVLVSEGKAEIVRRRETVDDIAARFSLPSWLAREPLPSREASGMEASRVPLSSTG